MTWDRCARPRLFGVFIVFALAMLAGCRANDAVTSPARHSVTYVVDGRADRVVVNDRALLDAPAVPRKGGNAYFVGWFIDEQGHMWDFAHDTVKSDLVLTARFLELSPTNVIVDAYLDEARRTALTFKTLQELAAAGIADGTTVNFAPGVYWTDDYKDPHDANTPEHPGLIGISFPQAGLTFKGLTSNADDVRIAGNRGQTVGSNGNWNVLGVGTHFSAYNLTIGNYTSVDLVFPRDPSQNVPRRSDARVQAQTITSAGGPVDRMYFENVRFVSFLNLIAMRPVRAYYKNSYFQLTDDAIASGAINVFENCTFDFYGSHPSYGGSSTLAVFLNSTFNFHNDSPAFWWSKSGGHWALLDNVFKGRKQEIRWENKQRPDVKHYVYNNVYEDGTPVVFDPSHPQVTQTLAGPALEIFKIGNEYNIHNLLRGSDGWNPSGQHRQIDTAFKLSLAADVTTLASDDPANEAVITPTLVPENSFPSGSLSFEYDGALFTEPGKAGEDGLHLRAKPNATGRIIDSVVRATAPNGLVSQVTLHIRPQTVAAPVVMGKPSIEIGQNTAALQLAYDRPGFTDWSTITWYRGSAPGDQAVEVGVSTLNIPYKNYRLSGGDIGRYLTAVIAPRYQFSKAAGRSIEVSTSRAIASKDVAEPFVIASDFANITWKGHTLNQSDVWYADTIKPSDVSQPWTPSAAQPWTYVVGDRDGASGVAGLLTTTQGARLLYQPRGSFSDMSLSLSLSPEKIGGQGFGSATDQYLEIYLKWDPVSRTGYALRFERLSSDPLNGNQAIPSSGNSTRVSLSEYVNGVRTIFPDCYVESSVYMPGVHVELKLVGNVLSADVTTKSSQSSAQQSYKLPNEIHFSAKLPDVSSSFGGFGVQFTGTASAGNRTVLEKVEVALKPR